MKSTAHQLSNVVKGMQRVTEAAKAARQVIDSKRVVPMGTMFSGRCYNT